MYYSDYSDHECGACGKEFASEHALDQHRDAKGHWPVECSCCYERFNDEENRRTHEYNSHFYCAECNKQFMNLNNLRMHLNSSRHRGGSIECPFCNRGFTTATGVAHHLETGSCPNADTNRDQMYRYVRSKDPSGVISKKLLDWHGSPQYEANERAWNGSFYECYLCHREFSKLHGLNQHLSSPAHQQALYHCPSRNCPDFKTLAGIINHLESESCGVMRFDAVQSNVDNMIRRGRLLGS